MNLSLPQNVDNRRGFTLIELMVVIVILGILAGLIVPRIMGRPEQAKQLIGRTEVYIVAELVKYREQEPGRVQALAIDDRNGTVRVDRIDEAANKNGLAGQGRALEQGQARRVFMSLAQDLQGVVLRTVGHDSERLSV